MLFDQQVLQSFLDKHHTQYIGKYRYHSGYQIEENVFKNHYYMLDQNFREIDIFVELTITDEVIYSFSEELHEQECLYIVKDAVSRLLNKLKYKSALHYSLYESFIKNTSLETNNILEPIDFYNVLDYMKYHYGINQETMDKFYNIFIPCLKAQLARKSYKKFIDSVNILLENVLYEYEWEGSDSKYLGTEYQYHLYYIREIIKLVYTYLDKFYKHVQ